MSELKPCPFCGIKPELVSLVTPVRYFYHCPNCGVGNELQGFDSDEAQRFWNTRPIEDDLRAELARRDEIIARLKEDGERLASESIGYSYDGMDCECVHCKAYNPAREEVVHLPDCPITLHRALIEELNQTGELK